MDKRGEHFKSSGTGGFFGPHPAVPNGGSCSPDVPEEEGDVVGFLSGAVAFFNKFCVGTPVFPAINAIIALAQYLFILQRIIGSRCVVFGSR